MDNISDICANCGKGEEGSDSLKNCSACLSVKYCSRDCQIAHRPQHKYKKDCKKRAAELHDELLFKQPPKEEEDCPICLLRIPSLPSGSKYMSCCGKSICCGCIHAVEKRTSGKGPSCPFCRTPVPIRTPTTTSDEEIIERTMKRVEAGDAHAMSNMGDYYYRGKGLPQDYDKALEFWQRAGEHGWTRAYNNIGTLYSRGEHVIMDKKKARHYYELAAMGGNAYVRHNLGASEAIAGNFDLAIKHWIIAVRGGFAPDLPNIQGGYSGGLITKDVYQSALRDYQEYLIEIKSHQRDEAAAANDRYRYYSNRMEDWGG